MAKKKKITKTSKTKPEIIELGGFKMGDVVWFRSVSGKIYEGTITRFHSNVPEGPCATMVTTDAGYRTTLLSQIALLKSDLKKLSQE